MEELNLSPLNSRGQGIAVDLMIAVLIFLLLMAATLAIWSNTASVAGRQLSEREMQRMAENAMDALIRGSGSPADWEQVHCSEENINSIGLAKRDRVLDENKLNQFIWRAEILSNGLVSAWHFNGNAEDSFGENDGTPQGTVDLAAEGLWETQALALSGSGYMTATCAPAPATFTISAWIKLNELNREQHIAEFSNTQFYVSSQNKLDTREWSDATGETQLSTGTWYQVAVVRDFDNSEVRLYLDGVLDGTGSIGALPGSNFFIGDFYGGDHEFNGTIEEVRIYDRALEAGEINTLCEWSNNFVKTKLLIGDNNYFFRLLDARTKEAIKNSYGEKIEVGINPHPQYGETVPDEKEIVEPNKLMEVKITRNVTFKYKRGAEGAKKEHAAIAEFTLHRIKQWTQSQ